MRRRLLEVLFALSVLALLCGTAGLQSEPQQAKPAEPAGASASPQSSSAGEAKPEGGAGAKHEAKEENEEAQFKQSWSVKQVARLTGLSTTGAYWVSLALNFALLGYLLYLIVAKTGIPSVLPPILPVFRERTAGIQKSMEEARRASEGAGRRLSEIEARLAKLDGETAEMRAAADREAGKDEEAAGAAAEQAKAKIVQGAEQEIAAAARLARGELKSYAAELAVSLAEKKIEVNAATDRALVREFVDQLREDGK